MSTIDIENSQNISTIKTLKLMYSQELGRLVDTIIEIGQNAAKQYVSDINSFLRLDSFNYEEFLTKADYAVSSMIKDDEDNIEKFGLDISVFDMFALPDEKTSTNYYLRKYRHDGLKLLLQSSFQDKTSSYQYRDGKIRFFGSTDDDVFLDLRHYTYFYDRKYEFVIDEYLTTISKMTRLCTRIRSSYNNFDIFSFDKPKRIHAFDVFHINLGDKKYSLNKKYEHEVYTIYGDYDNFVMRINEEDTRRMFYDFQSFVLQMGFNFSKRKNISKMINLKNITLIGPEFTPISSMEDLERYNKSADEKRPLYKHVDESKKGTT